jgi:thioredoxin reductase (NADPH)
VAAPVTATPDVAVLAYRAVGPRLSPVQLDTLRGVGEERTFAPGEVIVKAGGVYDFVVVLEGRVELVDDYGGEHERVVSPRGPGHFIGEYGLLLNQPALLTSVAREPSRVIVVSADELRHIIDNDPELSEIILRAFMERRTLLIKSGVGMKLVGSRFSRDSQRILEFLARNRIPFAWLDVESDPIAEHMLQRFQISANETPVVLLGDRVLRNPSIDSLAGAMGFGAEAQTQDIYDVVVIGAGPAGLAASVYAASEGLSTLALERVAVGGQAGTSTRIENYLGFPAGLSGEELAVKAALQAEKFNARITVPCVVVGLRAVHGIHTVQMSSGEEVAARAVIIATGAEYRKLDVDRLGEFEGTGVYYAATPMEARMCAGGAVAIVGGGNSAGQAAVFLARSSARVHIIIRRSDLSDTMSRYLIEEIARHPNIQVIANSEVRALEGNGHLTGIEIERRGEQPRRTLDVCALFVFIGADPCTPWLTGHIALDSHGFILTGRDLPDTATAAYPPGPLETSIAGVFAAGDVRSGSIKRVASAVGEGSMAVHLVYDYLKRQAVPVALQSPVEELVTQ